MIFLTMQLYPPPKNVRFPVCGNRHPLANLGRKSPQPSSLAASALPARQPKANRPLPASSRQSGNVSYLKIPPGRRQAANHQRLREAYLDYVSAFRGMADALGRPALAKSRQPCSPVANLAS